MRGMWPRWLWFRLGTLRCRHSYRCACQWKDVHRTDDLTLIVYFRLLQEHGREWTELGTAGRRVLIGRLCRTVRRGRGKLGHWLEVTGLVSDGVYLRASGLAIQSSRAGLPASCVTLATCAPGGVRSRVALGFPRSGCPLLSFLPPADRESR
jgi:hypothetical protein